MEKAKVVKVGSEMLYFDNGLKLFTDYDQACCESHWLDFSDLAIEDFEGLEFDLNGDSFFSRVEDYGIELIPIFGHSIKVPGYGSNNGNYSHDLSLILSNDKGAIIKVYDITECQKWEGE